MITLDNALWCLTVLAVLLAAWGVIAWLGREKPTDWDAPATDADQVDGAYTDHHHHVCTEQSCDVVYDHETEGL